MNTLQRKILIGVAVVFGMMLLFPPFLCQTRGIGSFSIGYAFILSTTGECRGRPGTINATQLVVQWLGVASIGAIMFALAKDYQPKDRSIRIMATKVLAAIRQARQRSMIWFWVGLGGFAVQMLYFFSNDNSANVVSAFGIAGAGLLFFVTSIIWHTTRILYPGPEASPPKPGKPANWARILIFTIVGLVILAWNDAPDEVTSAADTRRGFTLVYDEPKSSFVPDDEQTPPESRLVYDDLHPSSGALDDLIPKSQPSPGKVTPEVTQ